MSTEKDAKASTAFAKRLERAEAKFEPDAVSMPVERKDANGDDIDITQADRYDDVPAEQFPTAALKDKKHKRKDAEMGMKAVLSAEAEAAAGASYEPGTTKFGVMQLKDSDLKWVQRKAEEAEEANFQQWFAQQFDHMSPADKNVAKRLYPQFYSQRKQLLRKQADNVANLARIKLTGPENFHDLMMLYLAETGRLDLGPVQNLLRPETNTTASTLARYRRGLLNPVGLQRGAPTFDNERNVNQRVFGSQLQKAQSNRRIGFEAGFPPAGSEPGANFASYNQPSSVNNWMNI